MRGHERAREQLVHLLVGLVLVARDLLDHDLTLGRARLIGERGVHDHVAEDIHRVARVLVEQPRVVAGVLLAGERVELRAQAVERLGDVRR